MSKPWLNKLAIWSSFFLVLSCKDKDRLAKDAVTAKSNPGKSVTAKAAANSDSEESVTATDKELSSVTGTNEEVSENTSEAAANSVPGKPLNFIFNEFSSDLDLILRGKRPKFQLNSNVSQAQKHNLQILNEGLNKVCTPEEVSQLLRKSEPATNGDPTDNDSGRNIPNGNSL